jgi:cysteinyl-tRNA synthetase
MDDDLNTPLALSVVYELITETNKLIAENKLSAKTAENILSFWKKVNKVFGLKIMLKPVYKTLTLKYKLETNLPDEILTLIEERKQARIDKNFQKSDELRDEMDKLGYIIEDLKDNEFTLKKK